jgi:hypothetical protein
LELLDQWVAPRRRVWDRDLQRLRDAGLFSD